LEFEIYFGLGISGLGVHSKLRISSIGSKNLKSEDNNIKIRSKLIIKY